MKKLFVVFAYALFLFQPLFSQCTFNQNGELVTSSGAPCPNAIITGVSFLDFHANAQSKGLAEIGVVTSPFNNSVGLVQNPALLKRQDGKEFDVNFSYMPWLRNLDIDDIQMTNLAATFSWDDKNAVGVNYKHFSLGKIVLTDINGNPIGASLTPVETSITGVYSYRVTPKISMGLGAKYFISDLIQDSLNNFRADGLAFDLGVHYQTVKQINEVMKWHWNIGMSITNIGSKVSYTDNFFTGDYIPTSLKFGIRTALEKELSDQNSLTFSGSWQLDKLLVPSPQFESKDDDLNGVPDHLEYGVLKSMLVSFGDAPRGVKEEFWEILHKFGFETWLNLNETMRFGARTGYFLEHETKGNRKFLTLGLSASYAGIYIDYGHIIQSTSERNPLHNTFNISVGYRRNLN